ncbi:hypothetical protein AB0J55_02645 [Amycolatopsis sp. NPDC049688]|uniref:hypothetical protein n=1 Tax=Amycolatopsis sp. NPDC049688 TaxID=3154733 RepID=UPI00341CEFBA
MAAEGVAGRAHPVRAGQRGPLLPAGVPAAGRLGLVADEIAAGHCVALSRPAEPAELLERYRAG